MDGKKSTDTSMPRYKILLVVDRYAWCFHNIAKQIVKYLINTNKYEFSVWEEMTLIQNKSKIKEFDCLVFICWTSMKVIFDLDFDRKKIAVGIYDYLSWGHHKSIFDKINGIYAFWTGNLELKDLIQKEKPDEKIYICEDGVDTDFFSPHNLNISNRNKFVIGWTGDSKWGEWYKQPEAKGLDIIKKTCEQLEDVELLIADRQDKWRTHQQMLDDFYSNIDCYCCASAIEGTPNPVLETLSLGIPVITTDVGIVPQMDNFDKLGVIFDRDDGVEGLKQKILQVKNNYWKYNKKAIRNYTIENWDWFVKVKSFELMLNNMVNGK